MSNKKRTKKIQQEDHEEYSNGSKKRKILDNFEFENEEISTTQITPEIINNEEKEKKKKFTQTEIQQLKETEILFKSSFFRLAFAEILKESTVNWEKQKSIEHSLHLLKNVLENEIKFDENLLDLLPKEFEQIKKNKLKKLKNFKIEDIAVIGSFILRTVTQPNNNVDITLKIPKEFISGKNDNIDEETYFIKRAYFLCGIAKVLKKYQMFSDIEFQPFRGDYLKPIILITPKKDSNLDKESKFVSTKFKIKIIPTIEKFKNLKKESILEDCYFKDHLILIHEKMKDCPSLVETSILFKVWLKKRKIYETFDSFNGFLITILIIYLLNEKVITKNMSSFQMLRNILNWISKSDFSKSLSFDRESTNKNGTKSIILNDLNNFNLFFRISEQSLKELKYESKLSLKYLEDDIRQNGIESLFLIDHQFFEKYDVQIKIKISSYLDQNDRSKCSRTKLISKILELLEKSFSDRILFVRYLSPLKNDELIIGIKLLSNWRLATIRGPSPMEKELKKDFEEFWGEKSELRKFKDSSIVLSTVWDYDFKNPIILIEDITNFILKRHLKISKKDIEIMGKEFHNLIHIPSEEKEEHSTNLEKSLNELKTILLKMDSNLKVKDILPISSNFRNTSKNLIKMNSNIDSINLKVKSKNLISNSNEIEPLKIVIEFFHDTRWPDNLEAISKVKQLQYIDFHKKLNLKSIPNKNWIDIFLNGFIFRLSIRLPKEIQILSTGLSLNRKLIEMNRELYKLPLHTRCISYFSEKYISFSESVRLAKKWCDSHMFSEFLREELIELLVANSFSSPYPYDVPETPIIGFQRFISLLSNFDWTSNPLFVKVTFDDKDANDVIKKYNMLQIKPPMFVVASYNIDQNVPYWTRPDEPSFLILKRIVEYAKETKKLFDILFSSNNPNWESLFETNSNFFNVVVYLNKFKLPENELFIGFDPYLHFYQNLKDRFEKFGLIFRNKNENYFGIIWNPNKFQPSDFNIVSNSIAMKPTNDNQVVPNVDEIIGDIKKMGDGLIKKIKLDDKIIFSN
eukprot:gene1140-10654_t